MEAVRHAQAARDWEQAARLLSDEWVNLYLDGQTGTARELLTAFPAAVVAADAELTTLMAAGELSRGSPGEVERYLAQAARGLDDSGGPVPAERRGRLQVILAIVRLHLALERLDLQAVAEEADRLLVSAEAADTAPPRLGGDLRALAMINLGIAETWAWRLEDAGRHLDQGVALARRAGRPYLELSGLAHGARVASYRSLPTAERQSRQAVELAERHGWGEAQPAAFACTMLGGALSGQGRVAEAQPWLDRAGQALQTEIHPAAGMSLHYSRGLLDMARGRHAGALAEFRTASRLAGALVAPHTLMRSLRALMLIAHVELGETKHAEAALAGLEEDERDSVHMRAALAALRLAQHDPQAAVAALAPVLDGSVTRTGVPSGWLVEAFLLEAIARDALGEQDAAGGALERALDIAGPDRALVPFLFQPVPGLLQRQARQPTAHAALIADVLNLLGGPDGEASSAPLRSGSPDRGAAAEGRLREPLSQAETRVLRYLPTSLSVAEIAGQLYLSVNTVRTHMRHLYAKLGAHRRHEAVEQARTLGLLAPATRRS
jgi:LuxR family maltose regulon positive regulatory protein